MCFHAGHGDTSGIGVVRDLWQHRALSLLCAFGVPRLSSSGRILYDLTGFRQTICCRNPWWKIYMIMLINCCLEIVRRCIPTIHVVPVGLKVNQMRTRRHNAPGLLRDPRLWALCGQLSCTNLSVAEGGRVPCVGTLCVVQVPSLGVPLWVLGTEVWECLIVYIAGGCSAY